MQLTLSPLADAGVVTLPPDIVWLRPDGRPAETGAGTVGDFQIAGTVADGAAGLVAKNPLLTAVILCLMTDCRVEGYEIDAGRAGDRRGWPGDGFDIDRAAGEQALGSKLWRLRRMDLTTQTALWAQAEAKRALQPILAQGAAVRCDATASPDYANDRMVLQIDLYARDGSRIFSEQFDLLWRLATGGV